MSIRRKEIAAWAVANLSRWPSPSDELPCVDGIGCIWIRDGEESVLPILQDARYPFGRVDSITWWYGKRARKPSTVCPTCGESWSGDGFNVVLHCANAPYDDYAYAEPDAGPVKC